MKERVKNLRREQTAAESKLWNALRDRRFCNFKFRRQRIIGPYIVDFVCLKSRIIIEADGAQHLENKEYDGIRTQYLESCGYRVLRFWNHQILEELDLVLNTIYLTLIRPIGHLLPNWEKESHC
jgi:very-short-patch-repair endonuclease